MAGLLPNFLNQRLDQAFIAATLPASSLGLYATGAAFSFITVAVLGGVSAVLLPQLAARAESSSSSYLGCVLRWTIVFDLIVTVLLISLIPWGLPLAFGEEFAPAIPIAMVLALAGGFLGINTVLSEGFRGLGKPQFASLAELSSLCLTIIGLLLVLKPFGIIGAALVSLVSYMSATTIMLFLLARFDGGALADWRLLFLSELRLAQQWIWGLRKN